MHDDRFGNLASSASLGATLATAASRESVVISLHITRIAIGFYDHST